MGSEREDRWEKEMEERAAKMKALTSIFKKGMLKVISKFRLAFVASENRGMGKEGIQAQIGRECGCMGAGFLCLG